MQRGIHDENIPQKLLGHQTLDADSCINAVIKTDASLENDKGADLIRRHDHGCIGDIIDHMIPLDLIHHAGGNIEFPAADLLQRPAQFRLKNDRKCDDEDSHQFIQNPADCMQLQPSRQHGKKPEKYQPLQKSCRSGIPDQDVNTV